MFSILKKPQDSVNAEDLETLQDEIESRLVDIVAQKWELERDLDALYSTSPDSATNPNFSVDETFAKHSTTNTASSNQSSNHSPVGFPSGKLRNSLKLSLNDHEVTSDGFAGSTNNCGNGVSGSASGANSNETDSVSSESSLISTLTNSTIITATLAESGSQAFAANSSNNKRSLKNSSNDRPSKRFRQDSSNSVRSSSLSFPKRPPHCKHRPKVVPSKYRNSLEESRPNKQQIVKNEAPDKFWPFVEQFCVTPTDEQMKELEEMIKELDNDQDFYTIPQVGKKNASNKESPTKNDNTNNKGRKSKSKNEDDPSLGALTQRLVSSFIDETDDIAIDNSKSSSDASSPPTKKKKSRANKVMDANDARNLEKRIRQQLEEYSILSQQDDIPYTSEEDDVLRELLACQHELLSIQTQNKLYMQLLLKKAKRHAQLEKEREKLKEAGADVIAAYVRLIQAKQRKRNPTKKEKDSACKAIKVHEAVFKKCDELYMTSLDRNGGV